MNILFDFLLVGAVAATLLLVFMLFRARRLGNTAYQSAVGVALMAAFLLFWMNGAVGIIGSEDNPANWMYAGVVAVGVAGALIARFQPQGMARALLAMALAQALATVIAMIAGWGLPASPPLELLGLNGFFAVLWIGSALLFRKAAAQEHPSAGAEPVS